MFSGMFWVLLIMWWDSGVTGVSLWNIGGDPLFVLCFAIICLMRVCWRSICMSCLTKHFLLVHWYLDFGDRCSSSPCDHGIRHTWNIISVTCTTYQLCWEWVCGPIYPYCVGIVTIQMKFVSIDIELFTMSSGASGHIAASRLCPPMGCF